MFARSIFAFDPDHLECPGVQFQFETATLTIPRAIDFGSVIIGSDSCPADITLRAERLADRASLLRTGRPRVFLGQCGCRDRERNGEKNEKPHNVTPIGASARRDFELALSRDRNQD